MRWKSYKFSISINNNTSHCIILRSKTELIFRKHSPLAMSFLSENKLLFGAVGIALSSAAAGYVVGHYLEQKRSNTGRAPEEEIQIGKKTPKKIHGAVPSYAFEYGVREPLPVRKLREATLNHAGKPMLCSTDGSQLMRLLMQIVKAKKVIEIGVYTGYNTLSMAMTLPPGGKVVACDITDEFLKDVNAQQYFKEAGVETKIDLRLQSAITTLDELIAAGESGSYDLVFIDAEKTEYDQYYEKSLQVLRSGGLIVVDNVLWSMKVCNPEVVATDDETRAIHNLNMKIHKDSRVEMSLLPMADGITIAMKL